MRVVRFFAFLDLCGFTDFQDAHGDDEALAVVTGLRAVIRTVAPECGVRIDKWLGDGVMLVGVEPAGLAGAAVESVERMRQGAGPLMVRAGVAGGEVLLVEGDDYLGRAVNLAARLCSQARPGEVLAEATFVETVPAGFSVRPIGSVAIRGFHDAVLLVSLSAG